MNALICQFIVCPVPLGTPRIRKTASSLDASLPTSGARPSGSLNVTSWVPCQIVVHCAYANPVCPYTDWIDAEEMSNDCATWNWRQLMTSFLSAAVVFVTVKVIVVD